MSSPWADKQSPSGKNALEKQTAESKRLRSRKKQRFLFLFYHTKAGKATGRNANMQFVYTAGQAKKQSSVARLRILHLLPYQPKILRQKKLLKNVDIMTMTFVSLSVTQFFELKKPTNHRRILQKIRHSFFRKKPAKTPDFREPPAKSPKTSRKIRKITPRDGYRRRKRLEIAFSAHSTGSIRESRRKYLLFHVKRRGKSKRATVFGAASENTTVYSIRST